MPMDYEKRDTGRIPESVGTPLDMLFVQTIAGPDATAYPAEEDAPTVYYCKILGNVTYPKTVGAQTLTSVDTDRRDYVFNLCSGSYIEEDSIVAAFRKNNRLWTMDKVVQTQVLVLSHSLMTTSSGYGSLSRINPTTGAVVWTADAGSDLVSGTEYPRMFVSCDIDSRGNVYALWLRTSTVFGDSAGFLQSFMPQGIVKFDINGNVLATHSLPVIASGYSGSSSYFLHPRIRVDRSDDSRIYCGCGYNTDDKWLYRFDETFATTWSIGKTESAVVNSPNGSSQSTNGVVITSSGSLYVYNGGAIYQCSAAGVLSNYATENALKLFANPQSDLLRAAIDDTPTIALAYSTFPGSLTSIDYDDFPTPEALGVWGGPLNQAGTAGYSTGSVDVYFDFAGAQWTTSGGASKLAKVFVSDSSGTPLYSAEATIDAVDVARDSATGDAFVAGTHAGVDPVSGLATSGPLAKVSANSTAFSNLWVKNLKTAGSGGIGSDVAVRTIVN